MQILSFEALRMADQNTISAEGITSHDLMERAAARFASSFLRRWPAPGLGLIVCGPGNNGGDGLALARLLSEKGINVRVFIPAFFDRFSGDFVKNRQQLPASVLVSTGSAADFEHQIQGVDWLCDALLGAGINRPINGFIKELVDAMNRFKGLKISIDVPAGFGESENQADTCFLADWIGTFHSPKLGFLLPDSGASVGNWEAIDIGLHTGNLPESELRYSLLEQKEAAALLRARHLFSHKGSFGHGLMVAGSSGKMGASVLATKAMLRAGVGLATACVPRAEFPVLQMSVPEAMCLAHDFDPLVSFEENTWQAIGIGPGLGTDTAAVQLVTDVLTHCKCPLVLDADALNILALHPYLLKSIPGNSILTPHPKEWARLIGAAHITGLAALHAATEFAIKHGVYLVLKGAYTATCTPTGKVFFNPTGNPGMATGGSGDVLTGLLTGLLAQGYTPLEATQLGIYLHGLAGDFASKSLGQEAMLASDVVAHFGAAFQVLWTAKTGY